MPVLAKKIIFSDEAHFNFFQRHNWAIFFKNEQGEAVTVNGDRYRAMLNEFLFTKIEEDDIGNICFNRTALRATQMMSFGHLGVAI